MNFGEKIQQLRLKHNLTQEDLAEKLFISRTAISKWERNKGYPNIDTLKQIAKLFDVTIDELLHGEELINLAQEENSVNISNFTIFLFGLVDILSILFIFLPLFPNTIADFVYSSSLFHSNDLSSTIKTLHITLLSILSVIGVAEIFLQIFKQPRMQKILIMASMIFETLLICYLSITRQAYLLLIIFTFFIIKLLILFKNLKYSLKPKVTNK